MAVDSAFLFDQYIESVRKYKAAQAGHQKDTRPSPLLVDLLSKERVGVHPGIPDFDGHAPGMLERQVATA
jgi:hypothetical protein